MADYDNKTGYVREMYSDGVKQIREELVNSGDPHLVYVAEELDDSQLLLLTVLVNNQRQIELLEEED